MVEFLVGPEVKICRVHANFVFHYSSELKTFFEHAQGPYELLSTEPEVFEMLVRWMDTEQLFVSQLATHEELEAEGIEEVDTRAEDLRIAKLFFLCNKLKIPELQKLITAVRKEIKH